MRVYVGAGRLKISSDGLRTRTRVMVGATFSVKIVMEREKDDRLMHAHDGDA